MATTDSTTTEVLKHGAKFTYSEPNSGFNDKRQTYELYVSFTTEDMDGVVEAAENAFTLAKATVFEQAGVPFTVDKTDEGVKINPTFPTVAAAPKQQSQASKPFPQQSPNKFGSAPKPYGGGNSGGGGGGGFPKTPPNPTKQQIGFVNGANIFVQQSQKSGKWYFSSPEITKPNPRDPSKPSAVLAFVDDATGITAEMAEQQLRAEAANG